MKSLVRVRFALIVAAILAAVVAPTAQGMQPGTPPESPDMTCAKQVRMIAQAAIVTSMGSDNSRLPADMTAIYAAIAKLEKTDAASAAASARARLRSPAHDGLLEIPADPTSDWINNHSSYRYLAGADIKLDDLPDWGTMVVAHLRLDKGHAVEATPENPEGEVFTVGFLDGHVEIMSRTDAQRRIFESMKIYEALRTGADLPEEQQAQRCLSLVMRGVHAYADSHNGMLPPDLGAVLEFVPQTSLTTTPAQRARIFLSPKQQKTTTVPEAPTREWVNAHTRYVYLGDSSLRRYSIPQHMTMVLIHARPEDAVLSATFSGVRHELVPMATVNGMAASRGHEYARWIAEQSEQTFRALRAGEPLPAWVQAASDLDALGLAMRAYARAHDGMMPGALADLVEHIPSVNAPGAMTPALAFVSPAAKWTIKKPDNLTAEWVRANATYIYLPEAPAPRRYDGVRWETVIAHAPMHESYRIMTPENGAEMIDVVPVLNSGGQGTFVPKKWAIERIETSKKYWHDRSVNQDAGR